MVRGYLDRRTPWGAPWWIYAVGIGAANVARQLILPDDVSTAVQIVTFALMVVTVGAIVTVGFRAVERARSRGRDEELDERRPSSPLNEADRERSDPPQRVQRS
jgi:hypothetical protein